ncbi:ABC transporter ATP-binding protein [Ruegeria lacuscaerulensis]|uniref:ABC transporter ATP-binding protein n=1 Tax=Ruegeria lacuscaerulensis TaxID=55218 RepID=UPI00147D7F1E|nr:ABC transporter ATP-binding protein [Ruegeria lacuscaerulensis]
MTLLQIEKIGKSFGGLRALNDVNFAVNNGETVGLMGANGAGKTTLFSIIAGHQPPTDGIVRFKGDQMTGKRPDQICHAGIARTFQIVRPFARMTVRENVETAILFGGARHASNQPLEIRAKDILDQVGLVDQSEMPSGALTLSGRKKLEVARALGTGPELLLLDEVMAGLTPAEVAKMLDTLRAIKADHKLTIFIIEHVVSTLSDLSDRIIVLHHGVKIAEGTPREIAENKDVRTVYFGGDDT